jgi:hypothetical protein
MSFVLGISCFTVNDSLLSHCGIFSRVNCIFENPLTLIMIFSLWEESLLRCRNPEAVDAMFREVPGS